MSGFSGGGSFFAILYYSVPLGIVCLLVALVTRRLLHGLTLIVVSVTVAEAITLAAFASGMAQNDFTLALTWPFFCAGAVIASVWAIALKMRLA